MLVRTNRHISMLKFNEERFFFHTIFLGETLKRKHKILWNEKVHQPHQTEHPFHTAEFLQPQQCAAHVSIDILQVYYFQLLKNIENLRFACARTKIDWHFYSQIFKNASSPPTLRNKVRNYHRMKSILCESVQCIFENKNVEGVQSVPINIQCEGWRCLWIGPNTNPDRILLSLCLVCVLKGTSTANIFIYTCLEIVLRYASGKGSGEFNAIYKEEVRSSWVLTYHWTVEVEMNGVDTNW